MSNKVFYLGVLVMMLLLAAASLLWQFMDGSKLEIATVQSDSMHYTMPPGTLVFLARKEGMELHPGEIGCYNDILVAQHFNKSRYEMCHWVNGSYIEDGFKYYVFHTEKFDCIETPEGIESCSIYIYDIHEKDIIGRIIFVAGNFYAAGILVCLLLIFWWMVSKGDSGNNGKLVQPVQIKRNLQNTGA